jgi:Na+-transporting methylmalonyl-CoA/oxaloacetate decarboxylase gamma subunit
MNLYDALTVTVLGMGVVFSGLLLTSLLIVTFATLPRVAERWASRGDRAAAAPTRAADPSSEPVAPEVVSVITAVLEVERRLYHAEEGGRLTIARVRPS